MAAPELGQHVQITLPDLRAMRSTDNMDPDISSTLTDFLAYTEHLPSAVIRSMSLIAEQDKIATDFQQRLHELLIIHSSLAPVHDADGRAEAAVLRRNVSQAYRGMEKARRMAAVEGMRLLDTVQKDKSRLHVICRKLKAMPMPPSRDPTPEASSPQVKRSQPISEIRAAHRIGSAPRVRERKIMVPGEVLPPPNPDSPPPSEPSDDESVMSTPPKDKKKYKTYKALGRPRTPKLPKEKKERKDRTPKPARIRAPGQPGTNVHSAVAGISTSNALLALVAPPVDAVPGSKWLPWKRITEFELAKLRKRMKKNAIWLPSPAMRNRELKLLGRGQQAMEVARQHAAATGEPFIDEFGQDWQDPTRAIMTGAERVEMNEVYGPEIDGGDEDEALMNRGMRLNEAKKRKRERMLEEMALQAQLHNGNQNEDVKINLDTINMDTSKANKKRKRETTPVGKDIKPTISIIASPDPLALPSQPQKKLKLTLPSTANGSSKQRVISPSRDLLSPATADFAGGNNKRGQPRITLGQSARAVSAEPSDKHRHLRRGSAASLPGQGRAGSVDSRRVSAANANASAPSGRRRRPAPGLVTEDEDGRAKVSVGKRKAAPGRRKKLSGGLGGGATVEEASTPNDADVDPDEPRYCLCGDVSWGTMIACDNEDCDKEWFHLQCVDLKEMPGRRTRWFCPDCRKKLKRGQTTNGIVKD